MCLAINCATKCQVSYVKFYFKNLTKYSETLRMLKYDLSDITTIVYEWYKHFQKV